MTGSTHLHVYLILLRRLRLGFGSSLVLQQTSCQQFIEPLVRIIMKGFYLPSFMKLSRLWLHSTMPASSLLSVRLATWPISFYLIAVCVEVHCLVNILFFFQTVSREIRKILTERAANFNIALDDVSITSLTFGKEFTSAIEAKQVAAQEAERAKYIVEKAEQDKRSAIIRAQVRRNTLPMFVRCLVGGIFHHYYLRYFDYLVMKFKQ